MPDLDPQALKAQKKAEKAARRAAKVTALGKSSTRPDPSPQSAAAGANVGGQASNAQGMSTPAKGHGKKVPIVAGGNSNAAGGAATTSDGGDGNRPSTADRSSAFDLADKRVGLFRHLEAAQRPLGADASRDIHPAVLSLALQFASHTILGSSARGIATLRAFQAVVRDYRTPAGTVLSRNLTIHLSRQIDFLKTARPLSVTMGNAIRWLKQQISIVSLETSDERARDDLVQQIETFIRDKFVVADRVIVHAATPLITPGSTVLTFACSAVVEQILLDTAAHGTPFSVVVVDSRPLFEGKHTLRRLADAGIPCEYVLLSGLSYVLDTVSAVFLGAHAVLSNGQLYSRVGTALVAMCATRKNIPVIVCCESIKFSNRVQLDAVTVNELGNPDALVSLTAADTADDAAANTVSAHPKPGPLKDWRTQPNLKLLNIMYDLTPSEYIKKIVTEVGTLPASSVPVVLREYS
ncbi:uncharacterized protein V1518DRAFT_418285 [Limtongia smithiae]|uniref:uncharacterized protein n=1 Tax=Limtongia smithiae TaxID=1125753 RepID=UPI0034CED138